MEDLAEMSDSKIRQIIKAVDNITLVFVLKEASEDVKGKVLGFLGKRALQQFENFDRETGNPRKSELASSRKKFDSILKKLF